MTSRLRFGHALGGTLLAISLLGANAQADPVVWDTARAIAGGNGCNSAGATPDTWFIAAGSDVSVIFSLMGVDLTSGEGPNTAATSCLVRIPVTFDPTIAVEELDQTMLWGYAKDLGTIGQVSALSTFCNVPTNGITETVDEEVEGVEALILTQTQSFFVNPPPFCRGRAIRCLFSANVAVAALRPDESQDISIRIYGEDIEFEALVYWRYCA